MNRDETPVVSPSLFRLIMFCLPGGMCLWAAFIAWVVGI